MAGRASGARRPGLLADAVDRRADPIAADLAVLIRLIRPGDGPRANVDLRGRHARWSRAAHIGRHRGVRQSSAARLQSTAKEYSSLLLRVPANTIVDFLDPYDPYQERHKSLDIPANS